MSKNAIEQLADHLRHTYSDAHIHIDPGTGKDAVWFLDISRKDKDLNISWFSSETVAF